MWQKERRTGQNVGQKRSEIAEIAQNGADQGRFLEKTQAEPVELCGKIL